MLHLQERLQHLAEAFERQRLRYVIVGAVRARAFLAGFGLIVSDVEQRDAGEVLANLGEQPSAIVLLDRLIVEDGEAHIWLSEYCASHEFAGIMADQFPGGCDQPADKIDQFSIFREKQRTGRKGTIVQINIHFRSIPFESVWHSRRSMVLFSDITDW